MRSLRLLLLAFAAAAFVADALAYADAEISMRALPAEARDVLALVRTGGPFAYERDGVVFGNREGLLPSHPRGYYHEYTVPTPGAKNRGARRIICGGPRTSPVVCYYTADHYRSFARIRE